MIIDVKFLHFQIGDKKHVAANLGVYDGLPPHIVGGLVELEPHEGVPCLADLPQVQFPRRGGETGMGGGGACKVNKKNVVQNKYHGFYVATGYVARGVVQRHDVLILYSVILTSSTYI